MAINFLFFVEHLPALQLRVKLDQEPEMQLFPQLSPSVTCSLAKGKEEEPNHPHGSSESKGP